MATEGVILQDPTLWGSDAIGKPCAFAFGLMLISYLFTHDNGMLLWMGQWLFFLSVRSKEAARVTKSGQIHSWYDGYPESAKRFSVSEKTAKQVVEPIMIGSLGAMMFWFYQEMGWRPTGLPYFLLAGAFSLVFVETVKVMAWERQLQAMQNAKLEQQVLMDDFKTFTGGKQWPLNKNSRNRGLAEP